MKITFGIISSLDTSGRFPSTLFNLFTSIGSDDIYDDFEVLVVGGTDDRTWEQYRFISFDETKKQSWITKKKNIITEEAKYDNIVYMHDYVSLVKGWYEGFMKFGDNFEVCTTPILNADGSRFRDWTLWPDDLTDILGPWNSQYLLPYNVTNLSKYMYISGAYWIAKKSIMEQYPLDENLSWGESEDVMWSKQIREKYQFKLNTHSCVRLLKQKDRIFNDISESMLETLNKHANL